MHVTVDKGRCCGAGRCVIAAPEVFDQDELDGTVILLDAHPSADLQNSVHHAARLCPSQAIDVRTGDGTRAKSSGVSADTGT